MKFAIKMTCGGIIYISSLMTNGSDIQVVLRILPQQIESP
jgi:hypothetical protein